MVTLDFGTERFGFLPPFPWHGKQREACNCFSPFQKSLLQWTVLAPPPPFNAYFTVNATPIALIPPPLCLPTLLRKDETEVTTTVENKPLLTRQGIKQIKIIWNNKICHLTCPMELWNQTQQTEIFLWASIAAEFTMNTRGQHNAEEPIGWYWRHRSQSIVSLIHTWHIKSCSFAWTKLVTWVDKFKQKYVRCA